jgi:hypothetical protein
MYLYLKRKKKKEEAFDKAVNSDLLEVVYIYSFKSLIILYYVNFLELYIPYFPYYIIFEILILLLNILNQLTLRNLMS